MPSPLRIGLTGGIGSGKSTVAAMLVERGAELVDTDAIARDLTRRGGAAIEPIAAEFGREIVAPDGSLDRDRMRTIVFADDLARKRLEAILHPRIGAEVRERERSSVASVLVIDIPLLVESGRWRSRLDRVWLVDCAEAVQIERVMARSGWTSQAVTAVIDRQASRAARRSAADAVIHNEGISLDALRLEVDALWRSTAGAAR